MARYFIDTEFIEGFHKPLFGKRRHFIDLISIGIVSEDGRGYYAISNEFNPKDADKWVMDNVIVKLFYHNELKSEQSFNRQLLKIGKSNKQIAQEIYDFVNPDLGFHISGYNNSELKSGNGTAISKHFDAHNATSDGSYYYARPEFYGYYADYDWVLFCSLFGRMIDLPKGFPMYCNDLKQTLDEAAKHLWDSPMSNEEWIAKYDGYQRTQEGAIAIIKKMADYPKQEDEHNALADAKWNKKLLDFLNTI